MQKYIANLINHSLIYIEHCTFFRYYFQAKSTSTCFIVSDDLYTGNDGCVVFTDETACKDSPTYLIIIPGNFKLCIKIQKETNKIHKSTELNFTVLPLEIKPGVQC